MKTNCWTNDELRAELDNFLELYKTAPLKDNHGGGLTVNNFYVYFTLKKVQPGRIIESGVFQGKVTWMIDELLPKAKILCVDPFLEQLLYTSKTAKYTTQDFLTFTNDHISREQAKDTFIYFDDHQDQYERLKHAYNLGFKHLLWDDDYPEFKGKRHLSLQACLNNIGDPGFNIPFGSGDDIKDKVEEFFVFPPITKHEEPVSMEETLIEGTPILENIEDKYKVLGDDMHNYRWTTYTKLK
jgi:hypothetical protein